VLARRYHLLRVLGRGAMGAVWEAEDTVLRRTVAVKEVVLPGGLTPEERAVSCERTLREARAIARLGHPNVVTLFDVLDEDARPWVVMELVPSRSLADVVKEDGPLHPLRVATVGLAVLGALEAAHAASITHRDVKPGNILLGHDGRVKLTDFGIARSAGDDTITGTGLLVGSPSYIAPEIVKGHGAGPAADLWGLGATLYAAAEGRAPFSGGDAMDTLAKVVQEPPAPYERAGALVPALEAMLQKDPARRAGPVDARRLLLDVLRGGTGEPGPGPARRRAGPAAAPVPAPAAPPPPPAPMGPRLAELLVPLRLDRGGYGTPATPPPTRAEALDDATEQGFDLAGRGMADVGDQSEPHEDGALPPMAGAGPGGGAAPAGTTPRPTPAAAASDPIRAASVPSRSATAAGPTAGATAGDATAADATRGGTADAAAVESDRAPSAADDTVGGPAADDSAGGMAAPDSAADVAADASRTSPSPDMATAGGTEGERPANSPPRSGWAAAGRAGHAAALESGDAPSAAGGTVGDPAGRTPAGEPAVGEPAAGDPGPDGGMAGGATPGAPAAADAGAASAARAGMSDSAAGSPGRHADERAGRPERVQPPAAGAAAAGMTGERAGWRRDPVADPTDDLADEEDLDDVAGDRTAVHAEVAAVRIRDSAGEPASADSGETVALPPTPERIRPPGATTVLPPHAGPDPGQFARRDLDDEPTQVVARLPFGGPLDPPPRAPGRPPGPAADGGGPFEFVGDRPPADRRRRTLGALLAVLALLLVAVVAGVLLVNGLARDGGGGTAAGPSATPTTAAVPAGYRLYRGEGFTVGVPTGWTVEQKSPGVVDLNEPGDTGRFLRLIAVGSARPALEQLTSAERSFAANDTYAPYRKLRLASVDYRGYDAAEWEFTFGGSQRHVLYRGAVVGGRTYGLYLSVPADRWQESRPVFQTAADTFRPTPR